MAQIIDLKKKPQQEVKPVLPRTPVSHAPRTVSRELREEPELITEVTDGKEYDLAWKAHPSPSPYPRLFSTFIGVLLGIAGIVFFVRHEVMFPIVLIASSLLLIIHKGKKSEPVSIAITQAGVIINDSAHSHATWKSFWVEYQPGGIQELSLESHAWHAPYVKVPLTGQDPLIVRDVLMQYLPEEEHKRTLTDLFVHLLGF